MSALMAVLALALVGVVIAGCGSSDSSNTSTAAPPSTAAAADTTAADTTAADASASSDASTTGKLPAAPSLEGKTIAYIQTSPVDYFEKSKNGAKEAVEALGGKFVSYNSNYEPATEFKNVQDAVTQGVDGILLFSISKGTLESSARVAKQAGIPVVDYYGYDGVVSEDLVDGWVGADAKKVGELAGEAMVQALGDCSGCEVAQVQGVLGRGDVEGYQTGFDEVISKAGLKDVAKPTSEWDRGKALARMQDLIQKYPNLKGVFCHNDDTTVGCVQALKQAGKKPGEIALVTENGSDDGVQMINDGWLAGDVGWSPAEESALATHMLSLAIAGQKVKYPLPCHAPLTSLTKDNVSEAAPWTADAATAKDWVNNSACQVG